MSILGWLRALFYISLLEDKGWVSKQHLKSLQLLRWGKKYRKSCRQINFITEVIHITSAHHLLAKTHHMIDTVSMGLRIVSREDLFKDHVARRQGASNIWWTTLHLCVYVYFVWCSMDFFSVHCDFKKMFENKNKSKVYFSEWDY